MGRAQAGVEAGRRGAVQVARIDEGGRRWGGGVRKGQGGEFGFQTRRRLEG